MKTKKIATYALLTFVVVSIAYFVSEEMGKKGSVVERISDKANIEKADTTRPDAPVAQEPNVTKTTDEAAAPADSPKDEQEHPKAPAKAQDTKSAAAKSSPSPTSSPQASVPAQAAKPQSTAEPEKKVPQKKIIVYYFKTTNGCASCTYIENYTGEALRTGFKKQIDDGTIDWNVVNLDNPENKHYIQDYQLSFKSVIVAEFEDGKQTRWKNLEMVWRLYKNKPAFLTFVQDEVKAYLEGK
ncbi:MAG TPA: nitrophenyl compound nitroreductase subunit ArsF family protein [bacterium]|nr:nitrophenyl compound nitroreductase subunit ArsF family protein [bacterium]